MSRQNYICSFSEGYQSLVNRYRSLTIEVCRQEQQIAQLEKKLNAETLLRDSALNKLVVLREPFLTRAKNHELQTTSSSNDSAAYVSSGSSLLEEHSQRRALIELELVEEHLKRLDKNQVRIYRYIKIF